MRTPEHDRTGGKACKATLGQTVALIYDRVSKGKESINLEAQGMSKKVQNQEKRPRIVSHIFIVR